MTTESWMCVSLYLLTGATLPHMGGGGQQTSDAPPQTALGTLGAAAFLQEGAWSLQLQELEQVQRLPVVCAVAVGVYFSCKWVQVQRNQQKSAMLLEGVPWDVCIWVAIAEIGSLSVRQRMSWSKNMFPLLSCYLPEPLTRLPLSCPSS